VSQVNELMAKHDTNKSHYLEIHEWPEVPFRSDPSEDDADGDGRISRAELAAHLHKHANRNRRGGDERTERGDRGDDTRGERSTRGVAPEGDRSTRGGTSQPTTTLTSTRSAPTGDPNRRHAQSLMEQYDLDEDGYLDEEEWSQLRGPDPAEFDKNGDGYLSLDELTARIASMSRSAESSVSTSSGSRGTTQRFLTPTERLPRGLPEWFKRSDTDGDGQVSMAEFTDSWTEAKIKEFERYDLNGDGVITAQEALEASSRR
jgi:Ca2+-binding EF-hand superfamily protein